MSVPLLDLGRQYAYLKPALDKAVIDVLTHGSFILGPEVTRLENEIAKLSTTPYAVAVASGTDALMLALHAAGVGPGDEVITSDFSFFASAGVIHRLGARPILVDIDLDTYNISADKIEAAITPKTKAIVPVHLFGQSADMDAIMAIAKKHNLKVIEDAAQSIGAEFKGRKLGSIGDYGCFSFYPSKNLGAGGDAGIITMQGKEEYERCRMLRVHGARVTYHHEVVGYNSSLDTLQAAILLVKLPYLQGWSEKRQAHARRYDDAFKSNSRIRTPVVKDYATFHIYNQYTISVPNRDEVMAKLKAKQIGCYVYYPIPFHAQECFSYLGYRPEQFPNSGKAAKEVLSIPIFPELTTAEQDEVIATVLAAA
ncbi:MAG: DegT/DnrJ/EryC1/StrS family aminotransferase [Candidatus Zixiibacteriota bacterium]